MAGLLGRKTLVVLLKGFVAFLFWEVGTILGQAVVPPLLGLTTPPIPENVDPSVIMVVSIPAGMLLAVTLGSMVQRLQQPFGARFLTVFTFNYLIYGVLQVMEQLIFTTGTTLGFGLVSNLFPSVFLALAVAWLWKPDVTDNRFLQRLSEFFSSRSATDLVWRLVVAWLIYLPIYYTVGKIISPIVLPFYTNLDLGLSLTLPDVKDIVDMQLLRGALFLLTSFPVIVLWRGSQTSLWRWLGLGIFVQLAALPMVMAYWLPIGLRIPHALELTTDSFVQAFIYVQLLGVASAVKEQGQSSKSITT